MTIQYACISVLNSHAPVLEKTIRDIQSSQWFDSNYKDFRACRRRAEKVWNKSGNESDYEMFSMLRKRCNEIAASKKELFYKSKLSRYDNSQKSLYHFVDTFLDQTSSITLPDSSSIENVVNDFNIFFSEINQRLILLLFVEQYSLILSLQQLMKSLKY